MAATTAAVVGAAAAVGGAVSSDKASGDALDAQKKQNEENTAFIQEQGARSRQHIIPLFESSQRNLMKGAQGALDIFKQAIPAQANVFSEGNVRAQEQLLAGLPQIQNALMGLPVDMSGLQAQRLPIDAGFANAKLPNFNMPDLNKNKPSGSAAAMTPEQQAAIAAALGGGI